MMNSRLLYSCLLLLACWWPAVPAAADDTDFFVERRQYAQRLSFLIRQTGRLVFQRPGNEALVVLHFAADGTYKEFQFEERSGNINFDASVDLAVRKSLPILPPPPIFPNTDGPFSIRVRVYSGPG